MITKDTLYIGSQFLFRQYVGRRYHRPYRFVRNRNLPFEVIEQAGMGGDRNLRSRDAGKYDSTRSGKQERTCDVHSVIISP